MWKPEGLANFPELSQRYVDALNTGLTGEKIIEILQAKDNQTIIVPEEYKDVVSSLNQRTIIVASDINEAVKIALKIENPIVIGSAIDRSLKDAFFGNPDMILLSGSFYRDSVLFTTGVSQNGYKQLITKLNSLQSDLVGDNLLRKVLLSNKCKKVIIHALGPNGTNISQVARKYSNMLGIQNKSKIIIYGKLIEPQQYSAIARTKQNEAEEGEIHLHIECAVFYGMADLYEKRGKEETVFADEYNMLLDQMQLVSGVIGKPRNISSHPSPTPLVGSLGIEIIKSSSNSAALDSVISGKAEACVTTQNSLDLLDKKDNLEVVHIFGSPNMIFTIGTPLSKQELEKYL